VSLAPPKVRKHAVERRLALRAGRAVGIEPERARHRLGDCRHGVASSNAAAPGVLGREGVGAGWRERAANSAALALHLEAAGHGLKQNRRRLWMPLHGQSLRATWGAVHVSRVEAGDWLG